jgi:hypothetical protein
MFCNDTESHPCTGKPKNWRAPERDGALASERDGGIRRAFSSRVLVHRKAIIGALHLLYGLAKKEIAHTTKFNSLKDLAIRLGCVYLRELVRSKNVQYSSEQIVAKLLQCLSLYSHRGANSV